MPPENRKNRENSLFLPISRSNLKLKKQMATAEHQNNMPMLEIAPK
jgi:hypothetical protein